MSGQINIATEILEDLAASFATAGSVFDKAPTTLEFDPFIGARGVDSAAAEIAADWKSWHPTADDALREMRVAVMLISSWFVEADASQAGRYE